MAERIVIVGAGQASAQAVASLRGEGFAGALTMIGDEPFLPYQRPPLSKAYLMGTLERERLFLKPESFYAEARCELLLGVAAKAIDRGAKAHGAVRMGSTLDYGKLLLATGTRVRPIPVPHAHLSGIHYLRGIADVDALRAVFQPGKRLAIVGGGYIGLEVAAVAAIKHGLDVRVFEAMNRLMARAVSPAISEFYAKVHTRRGLEDTSEHGSRRLRRRGQARIRDGRRQELCGGHRACRHRRVAECRTGGAKQALPVDDGIVVDELCAHERSRDFRCGRLHAPSGPRWRMDQA